MSSSDNVRLLRSLRFLLPVLALALLAGCATPPPAPPPVTPALHNDPVRPAAARWVRTELYFAICLVGAADTRGVQWQAFLDSEVTPRFPDGLTVLDAYGQWLASGAKVPSRLISKELVILHEDTPQRNADIEALRTAWKQATGDQSVLRVSQPADISF